MTIWNAESMFDAVRVLGAAVRRVYQHRRPQALQGRRHRLQLLSMIFGGQIKATRRCGMFLVYSAGNFIEATRETCFFQVGESPSTASPSSTAC